ncbi:flagellar hook protein FlgE [Sphingomonas sp. ID0503]|uniref:flagellar hook protein FlgE n=1 Tax=Sphingomonas sp. ID0503 TaxID=3399691 RepID=UPI003AFA6FCB
MSFYTSLTGLQGATKQLATISNNVANVGVNGFKKSRVEFGDIISSSVTSAPNQMVGSGTVVKAIQQQFGQGAIKQTASALDLAISGEGFFAVKPSLTTDTVNYTRNGAFSVDADRYVVNSNGAHLQIYPVDGSGTVVASGLGATKNLQLPLTSGEPQATANVGIAVNLPASAEVITKTFDRFDATTYNQSSNTTIYDSLGTPVTATSYYVRTGTGAASTWDVRTFVGDKEVSSDPSTPTPPVPLELTFNASGKLVTPAAPVTYAPFTPGSASEQNIAIDFTASTQQSGAFAINSSTQDGFPIGQLENVSVDSNGIVMAAFSNGNSVALGKLVVATFANPTGLKQNGNSMWSATGLSGSPILGQAGTLGVGNIQSGALEQANVDITEELVDLIAAQRNFQANSKAIETANTLTTTIINMRS